MNQLSISENHLVQLNIHINTSFIAIIEDTNDNINRTKSSDSLPSMYNNGSSSSLEPDINPDEQEEKARLISQVLELQNTLDGGKYFYHSN